jgi:hypothetical protein
MTTVSYSLCDIPSSANFNLSVRMSTSRMPDSKHVGCRTERNILVTQDGAELGTDFLLFLKTQFPLNPVNRQTTERKRPEIP